MGSEVPHGRDREDVQADAPGSTLLQVHMHIHVHIPAFVRLLDILDCYIFCYLNLALSAVLRVEE